MVRAGFSPDPWYPVPDILAKPRTPNLAPCRQAGRLEPKTFFLLYLSTTRFLTYLSSQLSHSQCIWRTDSRAE